MWPRLRASAVRGTDPGRWVYEARIALTGTFALAAFCAALIAAPVAGATTYNNDTPIIIPQLDVEPASPYPSSITISGTAGPITDVNVGLDGFTHDSTRRCDRPRRPERAGAEDPGLRGDNTDAVAAFLTFDDAAAQLPDNGAIPTGMFRPTSHSCDHESFPAPGPLTTTAVRARPGDRDLRVRLQRPVRDRHLEPLRPRCGSVGGGTGSIPGGWSLDVKPDVTPLPAATAPDADDHLRRRRTKCKKKRKSRRWSRRSRRRKRRSRRCGENLQAAVSLRSPPLSADRGSGRRRDHLQQRHADHHSGAVGSPIRTRRASP